MKNIQDSYKHFTMFLSGFLPKPIVIIALIRLLGEKPPKVREKCIWIFSGENAVETLTF